jgi:uncharacterized membrane protein YhiD involved in acid resistance
VEGPARQLVLLAGAAFTTSGVGVSVGSGVAEGASVAVGAVVGAISVALPHASSVSTRTSRMRTRACLVNIIEPLPERMIEEQLMSIRYTKAPANAS